MNNNVRPDSDNFSIDITGDFYTTIDGFGYEDYENTILGMITDVRFPSSLLLRTGQEAGQESYL